MHIIGIPEVQGYKKILIYRKGRSWTLKEHNLSIGFR